MIRGSMSDGDRRASIMDYLVTLGLGRVEMVDQLLAELGREFELIRAAERRAIVAHIRRRRPRIVAGLPNPIALRLRIDQLAQSIERGEHLT